MGGCDTYKEQYPIHKDNIEIQIETYASLSEKLQNVEQVILNNEADGEYIVAPSAQHAEQKDRDNDVHSNQDNTDNLFTENDIGQGVGCPAAGTDSTEELIRNRVSYEEYRQSVRSINEKQSMLFHHVLKTVKISDEQFVYLCHWRGWCWKNEACKDIASSLFRHYNSEAGANPEEASVILTSPTG